MSLLPRLALTVAAALLSLLGAAATASADLRIPTLGEATTLSTLPDSTAWGASINTDGNTTFVAFAESAAGVMLQRIGATGTDFPAQQRLQAPGTSSIGSPRVAVSGENVYVAWLQASVFRPDTHAVVATSRDGGRSFSAPVAAGRPTGHGAWDVSVAADGDNVFVSWSDDRNRLWTAGSRDGGRSFVCQAVISSPGTPTNGGSYDIAVDHQRVHWVWLTDGFDVYTRRSTDAGRTLGPVELVREGSAADFIGAPNIDADGGVVAITTSQMYRMPRADRTGTDFGHQPVLTTSQDGGDTWAEQDIGTPADRCIGDYCAAPYALDVDGLDVYVGWRGQGSMWLAHSRDGGVSFTGANTRVGPYSYTWHTQQMPSLSARRDTVVMAWHSAPDPRRYDMDPIAAFSSDRGETFTLRTVDDREGQDLVPAGVAWGPDPQGAGFAWLSLERTLLSGDRNVRFKPLSSSEPDVAVLDVTPVQAAKDAARLAAGRSTTIRAKLRSAAPVRARVPLQIDLAYDEDGERVERHVETDVVLSPGVNTVQLLAADPVVVGAGRITAKVKVDPGLSDSDRSNDEGEGSRAVVAPRPLTVLFVPVAATDEPAPACNDVRDVATGFEEHALASWPVDPRSTTMQHDCSAVIRHEPGLTDAGLTGPRGLLARLDRQKWTGPSIDKVVGVTPQGWFSRQAVPGLSQAVGAAPLGGTLDAAIVERQNTGGWVVAHELAHQLGWTEQAGEHGNHLDEVPAPGFWVDERREISGATLDFMHFSTGGADVRKTTGRWISEATWDFLTTKLSSSVMGATAQRGVAAAGARTLALTGTVKADGSVVPGTMAEVAGEPDAGEGEGPLTFEQLDASGAVLQTRRFGTSHELGPIGGDAATGNERAVTEDAAFSLRVPALDHARSLRIRRDGAVLVERARSAAAPTVAVTAPAAGATVALGSDMTVAWDAADADGDPLTHFVALSVDGGSSWKSLGDAVTGSSLTVKATLELNGPEVLVRVTTTDGWNTASAVSAPFGVGGTLADGLIAFNDWQSGAVWTADIDGGGARKIADRGRHPRWSPDGSRLAWDATNLFTAKPDGGDVRQVTDLPAGQRYWAPLWAGTGTLLAKRDVNSFPEGNELVDTATGAATAFGARYPELCDVTADGSRVLGRAGLYQDSWTVWDAAGTNGTEHRAVKSCGRFSPDGRYAVATKYRSDSDSRIDVVVYDFQTRTLRNLTDGAFGGYNAYPTWSPTGEWIVWGSNKERSGATGFGATDLWRMRPDGTGARKIVDGAALGDRNFEQPDVQPARGEAPEPEPTREELRPVASAGGPYAGTEGTALTLDARGSAPGAGGAAVTGYAWDLDGDGGYDDASGARPQASFPDDGTYPVAVQVTDDAGRVATATADVTVSNAPPVISGARVNDDDPASFTATVADPGVQDVQTATIRWGDGSPAETVPVIAGDEGYLVSASHAAPGATVRLTVSDGDGGEATATAARVLRPVNGRPSASDATASVRQGETVDVDLPASDPEGDRLSYEIVDEPEHGRVSMRALDPLAPEQPEVTYLAGGDHVGEDTFTYRVSDGAAGSRTATVTVAVAPLPPEEGGRPPAEPEPELPAPEPASEPAPRGPGRAGGKPLDPQVVEDATRDPGGGAAPAASRIVTLPSSKRCVSRRRFRIRVRRIKGQSAYRRVEVRVNGKRSKVVRGVRDTATVDLRGLPKGRFTVRIAVTLADGRTVTATRRYRTCAKRPSTRKHKGGRL